MGKNVARVPENEVLQTRRAELCKPIVLEALSEGLNLTQAAAMAGVHPNTLTKWRAQDPEFFEDCELASIRAVGEHVRNIHEVAMGRPLLVRKVTKDADGSVTETHETVTDPDTGRVVRERQNYKASLELLKANPLTKKSFGADDASNGGKLNVVINVRSNRDKDGITVDQNGAQVE